VGLHGEGQRKCNRAPKTGKPPGMTGYDHQFEGRAGAPLRAGEPTRATGYDCECDFDFPPRFSFAAPRYSGSIHLQIFASIYGKGRISHDELFFFGEPVLPRLASINEGGQREDVGGAGDENEGHGRKNKSDVELRSMAF
jgi:hypothetical protein